MIAITRLSCIEVIRRCSLLSNGSSSNAAAYTKSTQTVGPPQTLPRYINMPSLPSCWVGLGPSL